MKMAVFLPLGLLIAGCAAQHSYYTADHPHTVQRDEIIAESNRFPTPGHRDTYSWYQRDTSRNSNIGGADFGYPSYGATAPDEYHGYYGRPDMFY